MCSRAAEIDLPPRDHLTIRIQPNEGISLAVNAEKPRLALGRVRMDFSWDEELAGDHAADAYETLLLEAIEGNPTLFLREDAVERAWEILTPVVDLPGEPIPYRVGTWGTGGRGRTDRPRERGAGLWSVPRRTEHRHSRHRDAGPPSGRSGRGHRPDPRRATFWARIVQDNLG
jgi:Glucose-6-phosphate dehydrogenase, C-terminal domain